MTLRDNSNNDAICLACGCRERSEQPQADGAVHVVVTDAIAARYCLSRCEPDEAGGFMPVSELGQAPIPHLHRTCKRCAYQWLERTFADIPAREPHEVLG
jgi:hypothetical protein